EHWNDASAVVDPDGGRPRIFFQRVPEAKTVKNRVHLDLGVSGPPGTPPQERRRRIDAEAARLVAAGATRIAAHDEPDQYWVVLQDPEGNEFCLD
ncbi:MAG: VOC family protein, partial [Micromonosporaceae bacterium]